METISLLPLCGLGKRYALRHPVLPQLHSHIDLQHEAPLDRYAKILSSSSCPGGLVCLAALWKALL